MKAPRNFIITAHAQQRAAERGIRVNAKKPPVVELDSSIRASYVRFSSHRVAETRVVRNSLSVA